MLSGHERPSGCDVVAAKRLFEPTAFHRGMQGRVRPYVLVLKYRNIFKYRRSRQTVQTIK